MTSANQSDPGRFKFGRNWTRFLKLVDNHRVSIAENSLKQLLERESFSGLRVLDVGSGSGLFSLAARNLGATVHSFDFDLDSVKCTRQLRDQFWPDDGDWHIERGDILDDTYLAGLGKFDIAYAWGVLHHTGSIWQALDKLSQLVGDEGILLIAIYNDQQWLSHYWRKVKQLYNWNRFSRTLVIATHAPYFLFRQFAKGVITRSFIRRRGMDPWRDILDWLGGYPFEVARPEEVLSFCRDRGFVLEKMTTVGGRHGCNEFVFKAHRGGS